MTKCAATLADGVAAMEAAPPPADAAPAEARAGDGAAAAAGGGAPPRARRPGDPAIKARVIVRKHERRLHGLSRCLESLVHWLAVISEGNAEGRVLFVGTDGDLALGTTSFVPRG